MKKARAGAKFAVAEAKMAVESAKEEVKFDIEQASAEAKTAMKNLRAEQDVRFIQAETKYAEAIADTLHHDIRCGWRTTANRLVTDINGLKLSGILQPYVDRAWRRW